MEFIEKITAHFKDKKKLVSILLVISVGIMLIAVSSSSSSDSSDSVKSEMTLEEYKKATEAELEKLCSSIRGVGKCRVTLSFVRGTENTYKGSTLIESKPPRVLGVSVVCRGADSDVVRSELTTLFQALFDIGSNRISILKLNS